MTTYRGDGDWGTGKGALLTAEEVDENFWGHEERLADLETDIAAGPGRSISSITATGSQITVHYSDGTTDGPFTLPISTAILAADVVTVAGTTFAPTLAAAQAYHRCTHASGCVVTIPPNADVAFPLKTEMHFRQAAAGTVSFVEGTGVTINGITGYNEATQGPGAVVTLKKIATDIWDIFGMLENA